MKDEKAAHEKNQPKKPAGASAMRAKRPATIDLKATEIKPEPAGAPEPSTSAAPPPPPPEPTATASSDTGSAAETAPPRDAWRGVQERLPKGLAWPAIGIAAAAAIVFFAVGLGAGQWLSGRTNSQPASVQVAAQTPPELLERIARLEAQLSASQKQDPQLQARLARLETSLNAARKDDPQLQARLAKLEAQLNAPTANDQQLMARIAAAEAAVKTLVDMTASREKRSDDIAALAREARDRASSAASAAEAVQKAQSGPSESRADIDALTTRIVTLEQSAKASQAELARRLSADDAKGRFAIAAIALRDSVDSSLPFSAELAAVKSLSGDTSAVAALEPFVASGVPSAETLGRELAGLMPSVWKIARKEQPQPGTFLERLQFNAEKIVRIRPAGEAVGDDPASVRARIETRAGNADIRGALAELSKLPPDARVPADAWIKRAQARNAAIAAARNISQAALGALVKPGS
jgi:predicted  nucleic acid-binding Zn-ribbon protein